MVYIKSLIIKQSFSGIFDTIIIIILVHFKKFCRLFVIIESLDSVSRDEPDSPLMQYIANMGISQVRYTITHFKHHYRVLQLISNGMNV